MQLYITGGWIIVPVIPLYSNGILGISSQMNLGHCQEFFTLVFLLVRFDLIWIIKDKILDMYLIPVSRNVLQSIVFSLS